LFETLEPKPADAILKLIAEHRDDPRDNKIDLGVGVYRDADGVTPILNTVKTAEQWLVDNQSSKAYLGCAGDPEFCKAIQNLTFGEDSDQDGRITTLQTPGGSAALRVAAELILRATPDTTMWVSDPTWNNHVPLLGGAGVKLQAYPYYDNERNCIRFDAMLAALRQAVPGDLVLLHGCCHNPCGADLSLEQWGVIADMALQQGLVPLVDTAYLGLGDGLEEDAAGLRLLVERLPEVIIAASCSKNMGLYRERTGLLIFICRERGHVAALISQALVAARRVYSMPPGHGAIIAGQLLSDESLNALWKSELVLMCERIIGLRTALVEKLTAASGADFDFIQREKGMFSFLGLSPEQARRLRVEHSVYMLDSSRINVAGVNAGNIDYLAEAVAKVL